MWDGFGGLCEGSQHPFVQLVVGGDLHLYANTVVCERASNQCFDQVITRWVPVDTLAHASGKAHCCVCAHVHVCDGAREALFALVCVPVRGCVHV